MRLFPATRALLFSMALAAAAHAATFTEITRGPVAGSLDFGTSIAVSGDICAVGSPIASPNGQAVGSVFIYERNANGADSWDLAKRIDGPDGVNTMFGNSVDLYGDTLVVGAITTRINAIATGAAYIYARDAGGPAAWGLVKRLTPEGFAQADENFGTSVAIYGDWAVVGAPFEDNIVQNVPTVYDVGYTYLYYRNQSGPENWGLVKRLATPYTAANGRNGTSVDITDRFVISGSPSSSSIGLAFINEKNIGGANAWGPAAILVAPDGGSGNRFGASVSLSGDEAIVGAPKAGSSVTGAGAAYIFRMRMAATDWRLIRTLIPGYRHAEQMFGYSVTIAGGRAVVGAWGDGHLGFQAGAAYVFERDNGGSERWGNSAIVTASNGTPNDQYGFAVRTDGRTLAVGAALYSIPQTSTIYGAAYIYPDFARTLGTQLATSAIDVPNDQGGRVLLTWNAMLMDVDRTVVPKYSIWRRLPEGIGSPAGRVARFSHTAGSWEWLADVPSLKKSSYSYAAATLYDSADGTDGAHWFMVVAHTPDADVYTEGIPVSAHSVDNLAPSAPARLRAVKTGAAVTLAWAPNREPDLARYAVYRGAGADLASTTPYSWTSDTAYVDAAPLAGEPWYAVRAADIHGNLGSRSAPVTAIPTAVADSPMPTEFALWQNAPNPFNPSTVIRFALPEAGPVRLAIYGADGRLVRVLVAGSRTAGFHETTWDGTDERGRAVASGVYVCRMQADGTELVRRMTLVR